MLVPFSGFHVYVHPLLLKWINICYQIVIHKLNQNIPVLKNVTIKIFGHYNDCVIMEFLSSCSY